jgi:hypothetical protein
MCFVTSWHLPSDTLVGATVEYMTGTYLAKHADDY